MSPTNAREDENFDAEKLRVRALRAYQSFSLDQLYGATLEIERAKSALPPKRQAEWLAQLNSRRDWLVRYTRDTYELEDLISNPPIERNIKALADAESKRLAQAAPSVSGHFEWCLDALQLAVRIHRMDREVSRTELKRQDWREVYKELPRLSQAALGWLDPEAAVLAIQSANLVHYHLTKADDRASVETMMKGASARLHIVSDYRACARTLLRRTFVRPNAAHLREALEYANRISRELGEYVTLNPRLRTAQLRFVLDNHIWCASAKLDQLSARR